MKVNFKFLDIEKWSIFATTNTIIPFLLLILTKRKINLKNIVFISILNMMEGELLPKILFTGFLIFMTMGNDLNWIIESLIYVLSVIIIHFIPYNNPIHRFVYENDFIRYIFIIAIIIWMLFIFREIFYNSKKLLQNHKII